MHKILFVITSMVANGAERVMSLLVNDAAERGLKTELILLSSDTIDYKLDERVKVHYIGRDLPKGKIGASYGRLRNLRKCIKDFNPDVIVSFLTICNTYTCLASMGLNIPVVVSERNDPIKDCPSRLKRYVRNIAYHYADGFIFQTEDAKSCFGKHIGNRSIVIPNPVKDQLPFADIENREKTIVAAGRLTAQKNYPMMLEAFSIFLDKQPEYKLHIYGDGELRKHLEEYAEELQISQNVVFNGNVLDLHQRITRAGMFALSSDYEGISNSLLESLSMGLPCISTDCPCGGSRYLIENEKNGLLVPTGDAQQLAEAMIKIADSEEFARKIGNTACEIRYKHSAKVIVQKYFDYIETVVKEK